MVADVAADGDTRPVPDNRVNTPYPTSDPEWNQRHAEVRPGHYPSLDPAFGAQERQYEEERLSLWARCLFCIFPFLPRWIESLWGLSKVFNSLSLFVTVISLVSTHICLINKFQFEMPSGLVSMAIVFPIVFCINSAFQRRERALDNFGMMKAKLVAIYLAHRDWARLDLNGRLLRNSAQERHTKALVKELMTYIRRYLSEKERRKENLWRVYRMMNALSLANEGLRKSGVVAEQTANRGELIKAGEISRVNQYLAEVMGRFQELKNIADYRTPLGLRTFCELFIVILPVIFGPHYAHFAKTSAVMGYVLAVLYSIVLVGLFNVQTDLEDPFDGGDDEDNTDDINLDVWEGDMDVAMLPWAHKSLIDYYNVPKPTKQE